MFKCNIQAMPSQFEGFSLQEQLSKENKEDKAHIEAHHLLCPAVLLLIVLIARQVTCNFHLKPVCSYPLTLAAERVIVVVVVVVIVLPRRQ